MLLNLSLIALVSRHISALCCFIVSFRAVEFRLVGQTGVSALKVMGLSGWTEVAVRLSISQHLWHFLRRAQLRRHTLCLCVCCRQGQQSRAGHASPLCHPVYKSSTEQYKPVCVLLMGSLTFYCKWWIMAPAVEVQWRGGRAAGSAPNTLPLKRKNSRNKSGV